MDDKFISKLRLLYDNVVTVDENSAIAKRDDKYCYIYKSGESVIKSEEFDDVSPFGIKGCMSVRKDKNYGVIGKKANTIIPIAYDKITQVNKDIFFTEKKNNIGIYDSSGKGIVKEGKHKHIGLYGNSKSERAIILITGGKKQYILSATGEVLVTETIVDNRIFSVFDDFIIRTHAVHYSNSMEPYEGDTKPKVYDFKGQLLEQYTNGFLYPLQKWHGATMELKDKRKVSMGMNRHSECYVGVPITL